ncbi:hypothetical protein SAMN05444167_0116 [Terriglobus roseus]|uniref:Uncharacterized protein n=1 Tax=Terriglobus roseus TaxID=392734 RepID=A0A1G7EVY6_9BACT|nr:hypothetical protein SAMN05444167_0116 [Terriglobus roseus]
MRTLDRILGWVLVGCSLALFVLLHRSYSGTAEPLVLSTTLCGLLLGSMNLMRAERPHDRTLAKVCVAGNAFFAVLLGALARATENLPLPLTLAAVCVALLLLSMRTRRRSRPM